MKPENCGKKRELICRVKIQIAQLEALLQAKFRRAAVVQILFEVSYYFLDPVSHFEKLKREFCEEIVTGNYA